MNSTVTQRHLPRKDILTLALLLRPGQDYAILGSWEDPQVLLDLSQAELQYGLQALTLLRPAIDAASEQQLITLLSAKLELHADPLSRMFGQR